MRVAVVGGTGFIGHNVLQWLLKAGADVTVLHRGHTPLRVPGIRSISADRRHAAELAAALAAAIPAVVIDMTAYTGEDMEILLSALPASCERLVVISSGDVYWTYGVFLGLAPLRTGPPPDERAALREQLYPYRARASGPDDLLYKYDKIVVERTAQSSARVPVTILRLPMVYGPGDPQKRVAGHLQRLERSVGTLHLNAAEAAWRCTRGYVGDVAYAVRLAALDQRATGEIFNLGEDEALTELEWIRAIATATGRSADVTIDSSTPPSLAAEWRMPLVVDTRRIRDLLEYSEPIGRQEGLRHSALGRLHVSPDSFSLKDGGRA